MAKKFFPKNRPMKKKASTGGRRRLQPSALAPMIVAGGVKLLKSGYSRFRTKRAGAVAFKAKQARSNFNNRLENSDNITTAKAIVIGKQRPIDFQEKVSRSIRPPLLFKRNYAFSAESTSGKKGMFAMDVNVVNNTDLQADITTYKTNYTTDTLIANDLIKTSGSGDGARFYIDKHTEKIQMMNSSTNSITGKVHLVAYRRDVPGPYDSALLNPVNMLMYYSTLAPAGQVTGAGAEQTVGNGWVFNSTGANSVNFGVSKNMPGSSINSAGLCAFLDPTLSFSSPHVKDGWNYWFRKVSSADFSLKPGQQFNSSFVFNDLPVCTREEQVSYIHLAGISYSIVVEFQGGIVGSSEGLGIGDGKISIGTGQLSVVRESLRTIGMKNTLRSKICLQTVPLATIGEAYQQTINPDTGVVDTGAEFDA